MIETRLPDCAFIIRTIKSFLRQQGLQLQFVLHPIHGVIHDHGQITGIDPTRGTQYSQVYLQVSSIPLEKREALRARSRAAARAARCSSTATASR